MTRLPRKWRKQESVWDAFSELEQLRKEMNRLFDFSRTSWPGESTSLLDTGWSPMLDVKEKKDKIILEADLPGMEKEDIDVSVKNDKLVIKGEKKIDKEDKESDYVRSERVYGSFYREVNLPSGTDPQDIDAEYQKGVLKLTIPKKESEKPRQIDVNIK